MKASVGVRAMTVADIPYGMRLKGEAGWNQIDADWRRFLALGYDGCFVAERMGQVIGSVTSCCFGTVGWVAMLLVDKAHRGHGTGRGLLIKSLEHLESAGARSIRLDATDEGRPLYESLGFRVDFPLHRYRGILSNTSSDDRPRPGYLLDLGQIASLDQAVTGTDRRILINKLLEDNPGDSLVTSKTGGPIDGFVFWRPGSSAAQIGPCIAERESGRALLVEVGRVLAGQTAIVDIPTDHHECIVWAEGHGLRPSREFWRMTRGETVAEDVTRLWASSGPEMG